MGRRNNLFTQRYGNWSSWPFRLADGVRGRWMWLGLILVSSILILILWDPSEPWGLFFWIFMLLADANCLYSLVRPLPL